LRFVLFVSEDKRERERKRERESERKKERKKERKRKRETEREKEREKKRERKREREKEREKTHAYIGIDTGISIYTSQPRYHLMACLFFSKHRKHLSFCYHQIELRSMWFLRVERS